VRAINHALTGSLIGLLVGEPAVAVPLAVVSHFVLDAIPHYDGLPDARPTLKAKKQWVSTRTFRVLLCADALLCIALVVILAAREPNHWLLASICAFAAASPDFLSINFFRHSISRKPWQPGLYMKFVSFMQWFQRPIGAVVEVAWFIGAIILLMPLIS
jgi:hypothetical protein